MTSELLKEIDAKRHKWKIDLDTIEKIRSILVVLGDNSPTIIAKALDDITDIIEKQEA